MGKLKTGINGAVSGKVGEVVGGSWNGIDYIRSKPVFRKPKTPRQLENQHIFGVAGKWLKPIKEFLDVGFKSYTPTNFGINAARSILYKTALVKDGYDTYVDSPKALVSYGSLPLAANIQFQRDGQKILNFTWDSTTVEDSDPCDQVMLLAYEPITGKAKYSVKGEFRRKGSDNLDLGRMDPGTYYLYVAFVAEDRSRQSMSQYLGAVEL